MHGRSTVYLKKKLQVVTWDGGGGKKYSKFFSRPIRIEHSILVGRHRAEIPNPEGVDLDILLATEGDRDR